MGQTWSKGCYSHTRLGVSGIYLHTSQTRLLKDSDTLVGLLKTTCPRFPATRWSQWASACSSLLPSSLLSFLPSFLPFFSFSLSLALPSSLSFFLPLFFSQIESSSYTRHFSGAGDPVVNKTVNTPYSQVVHIPEVKTDKKHKVPLTFLLPAFT